ncbi:hypothetical protein CRM79_06605 [Pantoea agglomerans]|nr:hypothetical protein [Pantoea agglomerans]PEI02910.1 hypothetical protein CRM79_06605 [Pantoea agglomerans]
MKLLINVMLLIMFTSCPISIAAVSGAQISLSQYNSLDNVSKIFKDQNIVYSLKSVLGNDYGNFSQNFGVYGEPHKTANGGIFVEGWLKDLYLEQASAFVIQPDGKVYAAWMLPEDDKIHYVSNDRANNKMQEDIASWAKRFDKKQSDTPAKNQKEIQGNGEKFFETAKFKIRITSLCAVGSECNDVSYEGVRKSDRAVVRLKGKAMKSDCGEVSCPVLSYKFRNHDATYIINNVISNLTVVVNNKIVLSEDGKWKNDSE